MDQPSCLGACIVRKELAEGGQGSIHIDTAGLASAQFRLRFANSTPDLMVTHKGRTTFFVLVREGGPGRGGEGRERSELSIAAGLSRWVSRVPVLLT